MFSLLFTILYFSIKKTEKTQESQVRYLITPLLCVASFAISE